jgi:hypothetical protein
MVGSLLGCSKTATHITLLGLFVVLTFGSCSSAPWGDGFVDGLGADVKASFTPMENLVILGSAFAGGMALDSGIGANAEDRVAHFFTNNDVIPDSAGHQLDILGSGIFLFGAAGAWHGGARLWGDAADEQASLAMISALSITGITTLTIKSIINDGRPNGSAGGYPSGHSSMAMAAAASLGESYGWKVGVPAYLAAIAVGVQRLDSRQHDLDDVIGGLALGYVVGSSIAGRRLPQVLGGELQPIIDPIGGEMGLVVLWNF